MSLKMNIPLMEQEPDFVISVISTIVELQIKLNQVLKMLKTDFDPNVTFTDNEDMKYDEVLHQVIELGRNNDDIQESVLFSCKINLKGTTLNQYKKITIIITHKKIYSLRKKNIKPII
jgi:hypothetical protein